MRNTLLSIAILLFVTIYIFPQTKRASFVSDQPNAQNIDHALKALEEKGLNGVILIRSKDKVMIHKAYGMADRENNRPMTLATGFDLGSLVKPFTGAAILRLEEMGKLSTADTIYKYIRGVPDDKKSITIMQVLTHKAGLRDSFGSDYELVSREQLIEKVLNANLIGPAGERRYSNSGYSLLATIIENVSGKTFEQFVRDEVLKPAGVKRIGYRLAGWKNDGLAVGYWQEKRWGTPLEKKWLDDGPSWNLRGNGGMLGTAEELSVWFDALMSGKVLKKPALDKYLSYAAGKSRALGVRAMAIAGGNDVFNAFHFTLVDDDFHLTFFTSDSRNAAEHIFPTLTDAMALAKEAVGTKQQL
jgi:CubicO group peptidase (beta-lactamase class C family)